MEKKQLSNDPIIYSYDNFLSEEECDHFIKVGEPLLKRSVVSDDKGGYISNGRTSSNAWIPHKTDEILFNIASKISNIVDIPVENAESFQFLHYGINQLYNEHYDSYVLDDSEKTKRCLRMGGQRKVTCLIYLNNVEEGGNTRFTKINIESQAKKGKIIVFHNCLPGTTEVHPLSAHAACPIIKGEKYAVNLWFRELPINTIYTFPYLKTNEDKDINKSDYEIINNPNVIRMNEFLSPTDCNYLLNSCVDGNIYNNKRTIYWIKNKQSQYTNILKKFASVLNIEDNQKKNFESMNIIKYHINSDHGYHTDAFDLNTTNGEKNTKTYGQRLYTFVCLLNINQDLNAGQLKFKSASDKIPLNQGDVILIRNTISNETYNFQVNSTLNYAIFPCKNEPKHYLYLHFREKNNEEKTSYKKIQEIDKFLSKKFSLKMDNTTIVMNKESKPENYYETLTKFYSNVNRENKIISVNSIKANLHNSPLDLYTITILNSLRKNNWNEKYKSLIQAEHFTVKNYIFDEYNPIIINNVFNNESLECIRTYFLNSIENNCFKLGDKQSNRYKAYDDIISRILQYECLPLIEKITESKLIPTYTYFSGYVTGTNLPPHTDRPDCEYTVSLIIDKPKNEKWPIYIDKEKQQVKHKGRYSDYNIDDNINNCIAVDCEVGGLMCFQGTDHIHFRKNLEYSHYYVTLLHYKKI